MLSSSSRINFALGVARWEKQEGESDASLSRCFNDVVLLLLLCIDDFFVPAGIESSDDNCVPSNDTKETELFTRPVLSFLMPKKGNENPPFSFGELLLFWLLLFVRIELPRVSREGELLLFRLIFRDVK